MYIKLKHVSGTGKKFSVGIDANNYDYSYDILNVKIGTKKYDIEKVSYGSRCRLYDLVSKLFNIRKEVDAVVSDDGLTFDLDSLDLNY